MPNKKQHDKTIFNKNPELGIVILKKCHLVEHHRQIKPKDIS